MDPVFFLLAGIAFAVPLLAKAVLHHSITWQEWAVQTGLLLVVLLGTNALMRHAQTADVRIQNGAITSKAQERVSCEHSYSCNCRTTTVNGTTSTTCSTCYEHSHDYDWVLATTVGSVKVPRIDRRGVHEPPRFAQAAIGDPVAVRERWSNPIKGSPESLFHGPMPGGSSMLDGSPSYPDAIVDLTTVPRVFAVRGAFLGDLDAWHDTLARALIPIGHEVRGNVVVVATADQDRAYAKVLERLWLRGKSNDTVVVLGVDRGRVAWAESFGWSDDPRLYVDLRHGLEGLDATPQAVVPVVSKAVLARFKAIPDDRFAYLAADVRLPTWALVLLALLTLGLSAGTTWWFHRHDMLTPTHHRAFPRFSRR